MQAIVYTQYGGPDVLELREVDKPCPKDDEVLIRVHAVSLNDWDWGLLQGTPLFTRVFSGPFKPGKRILCSDVAGHIETVGKNVTKFKAGNEVFGDLSGRWGGLAEYVCASENTLALKPKIMSFQEAAAIPQAGMLAVQGLIDRGQVRAGQKLLINGAGGGVGTFALQIAKLLDVEVTGVDNSGKLEMMRSMGFDHVIDYKQHDFTKNGKYYDLILDVNTNRSVFDYLRVLSSNGVYVTVGGSMTRLLQILLLAPWIRRATKKHMRIVALQANKDLAYMASLFEAGKVKPVIDARSFKLKDAAEAFRIFGKGEQKGKIVITI